MDRRYETALPGSSRILLTVPRKVLLYVCDLMDTGLKRRALDHSVSLLS